MCLQRAVRCLVKNFNRVNKYCFAPPVKGYDVFEMLKEESMPTGQKIQETRVLPLVKVHVLHATIMIVHRGLLQRFMSRCLT